MFYSRTKNLSNKLCVLFFYIAYNSFEIREHLDKLGCQQVFNASNGANRCNKLNLTYNEKD